MRFFHIRELIIYISGRAEPDEKKYSQVICTVPLGCLAAIDIPKDQLSYTQRVAIRSLNYDTSTKIALKFESRWWEDPKIMPKGRTIKGGISSTDLPIRTCVYPSYGFDVTSGPLPGVLLASYTWAQDAQRLGGLMHGKTSPVTHDGSGVFAGLPSPFTATRYHSLVVEDIPDCLAVNATSATPGLDGTAVMGFRHRDLPIHGVQFHPESIATEHGHALLANFVQLCGIETKVQA